MIQDGRIADTVPFLSCTWSPTASCVPEASSAPAPLVSVPPKIIGTGRQ